MTPMVGLMPGIPELLIILAVVLLLFGGTRLAGLGKSTGRAIKEFKDETKGLKGSDPAPTQLTPEAGQTDVPSTSAGSHPVTSYPQVPPSQAEIVDPVDGDRR